MAKKRDLFIASVVVALVLGVFITPAIPLIFGFGTLFVIWAAKGGLGYGNPHRKRAIEQRRIVFTRGYYSQVKEIEKPAVEGKADAALMLTGLALVLFSFVLIYT